VFEWNAVGESRLPDLHRLEDAIAAKLTQNLRVRIKTNRRKKKPSDTI
jgi:hypothetical protein